LPNPLNPYLHDSEQVISKFMDQYIAILVLVAFAAMVGGLLVTLSWVFGPKKPTPYKEAPYECGVTPVGDAKERFPIKFYIVAIIFIIFDIEVVFLWSWMTVFREASTEFMIFTFYVFLAYMATWILGDVYALRVGAFDWDETSALLPEKLEGGTTSVIPQQITTVGVGGGTK
jgi:NADH-quinone oxidoreductase subunit A